MRLEMERMIAMIDEIYDRQYRSARHELNGAIGSGLQRFGKSFKDVFEVLVGIEYQAPWTAPSRRAGCN